MTTRDYKTLLIFAAACVFVAAASDGLTETLLHHYPTFSSRFPGANPYWWNPALSWENKGDNFLTRTLLAWMTDAYHFTRFLSRVLLASGFLLFGMTSPLPFSLTWWRWFLIFGPALIGAWLLGFYLSYSVLF